jgi:hypothetical protein
MLSIIVSVLSIGLITVLPVMLAARFVGAERRGFSWHLFSRTESQVRSRHAPHRGGVCNPVRHRARANQPFTLRIIQVTQ